MPLPQTQRPAFAFSVTTKTIPWVTLVVAAASLLCQCYPAWRNTLVFDRHAILVGEWWRLWSGHIVHFGWPHWFADAGLLVILGWIGESRQRILFSTALAVMPVIISGAILCFDPTMERYAGLSALNMSLLVYLACRGWQHNRRDWFYPAILLAYIGEVVFEKLSGGTGGGMIRFDDTSIHVAIVAHIAGAILGIALWLTTKDRPGITSKNPCP